MAYRNPMHGNSVERSSDPEHRCWIGTFGVRVSDKIEQIPYNDGQSLIMRCDDKYIVFRGKTQLRETSFERQEYLDLFCKLKADGEYYFSPIKFRTFVAAQKTTGWRNCTCAYTNCVCDSDYSDSD